MHSMEVAFLPSRGCIWADKVSDPARRTDQLKPLQTNPERVCSVTYNRCLSDLKSPKRAITRAPPEYENHTVIPEETPTQTAASNSHSPSHEEFHCTVFLWSLLISWAL
nr:PREDICTED: uncharacterized protein LOC109633955 isoform X2 [Paralichthys olivaceus]